MQKPRFYTFLILIFFIRLANAQNPESVQSYINTYKDLAIDEMKRTGVPAAIKLAQGIHETDAGNSILVKKSNNHFGIKCKSIWTGESVKHDDDARNECFRKYKSDLESYRDHSDFLKGSQRYSFLFSLDPTDYQGWALGLKKAGYATNPRYSQVLIKLIEDYQLQDYTLIALGKKPTVTYLLANAEFGKGENKTELVFTEVKNSVPDKTESNHFQKIMDQKPVYPEGEFKIYETRVIFASQGTSFLSIAQQYNIPLARLFEFNELPQSEVTDKDRLIYIQRKRKTGNQEFHIVKPGESLHDIAQEEAIRIESLLEYNMLTKEMWPAEGEKLYLRNKAPSKPKLILKEGYSLANFKDNEGH